MATIEEYRAGFDIAPGYLNWASFGPLSRAVRDDGAADLELLGSGRPTSLELIGERAESARGHIAAVLGRDAEGVTLQDATCQGIMHAVFGVTGGVVISREEYPGLPIAVARAAEALHVVEPQWIEASALPHRGWVTPDAIRAALTPTTAAVVVSLVDYITGHRTDLAGIRDVIGDRLLIVDATQGFGVVEADYAAADVVAGHGYKWLRAGRGTAFAWFGERALERLIPVFSGLSGTTPTEGLDPVPEPVRGARAFTISPLDPIAHARQATAVAEVEEVGVGAIEAAIAERVERMLELVDRAGLPILTPREPARRAGILTIAPEPGEVAALAASLSNAGVASTLRAGTIRLSAHAGTDDATLDMLGDALAAFAAARGH